MTRASSSTNRFIEEHKGASRCITKGYTLLVPDLGLLTPGSEMPLTRLPDLSLPGVPGGAPCCLRAPGRQGTGLLVRVPAKPPHSFADNPQISSDNAAGESALSSTTRLNAA